MLELIRRFWRTCCIAVSDKAEIFRRLDDLEHRAYVLEQDNKRLLAALRASHSVKK